MVERASAGALATPRNRHAKAASADRRYFLRSPTTRVEFVTQTAIVNPGELQLTAAETKLAVNVVHFGSLTAVNKN
jgi:hypothetical protein